MDIRTPIGQAVFLVSFSCIIGFGSNLVKGDAIPWIAPELEIADSIIPETESNDPVLLAISLNQAKNFLMTVFFLWMQGMMAIIPQDIFRVRLKMHF